MEVPQHGGRSFCCCGHQSVYFQLKSTRTFYLCERHSTQYDCSREQPSGCAPAGTFVEVFTTRMTPTNEDFFIINLFSLSPSLTSVFVWRMFFDQSLANVKKCTGHLDRHVPFTCRTECKSAGHSYLTVNNSHVVCTFSDSEQSDLKTTLSIVNSYRKRGAAFLSVKFIFNELLCSPLGRQNMTCVYFSNIWPV